LDEQAFFAHHGMQRIEKLRFIEVFGCHESLAGWLHAKIDYAVNKWCRAMSTNGSLS
jgi:hypothetical protein